MGIAASGDAWRRERSTAGFTVVEMVVALSVITIVGVMTLQAFAGWMPRLDLRGSAHRAQFLISKARLESIQSGVVTVVQADLAEGSLFAFADVNGDPAVDSAGYASYLKFDPDPTLPDKRTDYEIGYLRLERASFGAPPGYDAVAGLTAVPGSGAGAPGVLVFSEAGVPAAVGAWRFVDGGDRNSLEVAVTSLAGKVEIRKFLRMEDSPTTSAGFFPEAAAGDGANVWVWY